MQKTVIIIRGASGSGKTTFANQVVAEPKVVCTADDWFEEEYGYYNWNVKDIGKAHAWCRDKFLDALDDINIDNVVVCNTNTKRKDFKFYEDTAKERGIPVHFVVMENRHEGENVHGVPDETVMRQKEQIIQSLTL